ncbi:hypothetical protein SPRG_19780 [Saprolegnia parasitica CBS 223.65]|uniref:Intimal thickness related receptor IRP domain-containing protein n=1 Tax=Saprolegnia parasitica (strain CBS 223.65) TaxID=695850 RepID=A0A067CTX8_SAPPC|nr:hypothetical protein SPRG_19780 [Saprolegnia parasitica CBS 223.65]KDO30222.1 hypothetical protein SPRG_19780 [Saprolegnia parasitica CBS 223.65]|eukprot:XP_012199033.1 hypothetical protein SPRG_19780 [Saprolegnia parasitica CBS 223.65]
MLLLLLTSILLGLVRSIEFTQPYVVQSSSDLVPLVDVFNFTRGGEAVVYLDVTLQATPAVVQGRTMMYLLLCDDMVFGDSYCRNRTLGVAAGCRTFPLRQSSFVSLYNQTSTAYHTITYLHVRVTEASAGAKFLFLDVCEALGGTHGWLPSCMKNATGLNTTCFTCPDMLSNDEDARSRCIVSPTIAPNVTGQIDIAMCDGDGQCLGDSVADLLRFYMAYAALWIVLTLLWVAPLLKKPYLCLRLHYLFAIIALMETSYALLSCVTFSSPLAPIQIFLQFGYSVVGALFLQFLCRCFTVQLVLMLADGYQVTQNGLENPTWISLDWTFVMFWTICRNASLYSNAARGPGVLRQIQWSVACYLMFSNYSHARRHVKRLRNLTFEMQVRLHIDPATTPIMEKLRVFYALPAVFFAYFPLLWINNQLNWMPIPHFIADHGIFTLLCLHLGYRFRVRRFYHEFLLSPADTILPPPPPEHPTTFVLIQPPNPSEPTACGALAAPRSPTKPRQDPL